MREIVVSRRFLKRGQRPQAPRLATTPLIKTIANFLKNDGNIYPSNEGYLSIAKYINC